MKEWEKEPSRKKTIDDNREQKNRNDDELMYKINNEKWYVNILHYDFVFTRSKIWK